MSTEKKDKKSKRDKSEHQSKKRQLEAEGQPEEERKHKRSKSEAPTNDLVEASPDVINTADQPITPSGKSARSERRKQKKRQSNGGESDEANADASLIENTAANGVADEVAIEIAEERTASDKKRKGRRKQTDQDPGEETHGLATDEEQDVAQAVTEPQEDDEERKKRKKEKKEKRRKEKEAATEAEQQATQQEGDGMDIDSTSAKPSHQPFGKLPDEPYPFFSQQVSQYLPLFPLGMIEPVDGYSEQHLKPLMNHYVPTFEGVLLGYSDVRIGEAPGRASITENSENSEEAVLESIDEYAVTFGWLTAKLDLFKPSRGAWMEGSVNMQTEGHLGIVCWGMFNASIEAARLPEGWKWVSLLGEPKQRKTFEEAKLPTPEPIEQEEEEEEEEGEAGGEEDVSQLHTTGYWVNNEEQRVRGNVRFQIKNFEVGTSGDYGYLSIEGTMLDTAVEKEKAAEEMERSRRWKLKNGAVRKEHRRLPDFSMTKFGMDEEQETEAQRTEIWKGSRPASETAE